MPVRPDNPWTSEFLPRRPGRPPPPPPPAPPPAPALEFVRELDPPEARRLWQAVAKGRALVDDHPLLLLGRLPPGSPMDIHEKKKWFLVRLAPPASRERPA